MKSLDNQTQVQELLQRLDNIAPQSQRQWGKMTPHQMICHLNDSFKLAMGDREISAQGNFFTRTLVRWAALHVPLQWPKGVKTMPEIDQQLGGTKPLEFEKDMLELKELINRFVRQNRDFQWQAHAVFGEMSEAEWLRWGYLHVDHHLRQFGA